MSEFEYLAVFVSMIFGISVTHVLAGAIRSIYRSQIDETHFVLTGFFFLVLVLNWWVGFSWHSHAHWSFDEFLIIVIWAVSHYVASITLYPPRAAGTEQPFEYRRNWFLWAFAATATLDIIQTAARGELFTPWYYLPFVVHYIAGSLLAIAVDKPWLHRLIAWYFFLSMATWAFLVRRLLE